MKDDKKTRTTNLHNNYLVQCLDEPKFALEFFQAYLADYAKYCFDPDSLKPTKGHYVSNEFADYYTDVLYQGKLKNTDGLGYIYLLCEHKSVPEKTTDIQLVTYMMNIALKHRKEHPGHRLPVIVPMVLYHGQKTPYPYNLDWLGLFDDPDHLMAQVFANPMHLVDLNTYQDEELKQFKLVGVMSRLMKHIRDADLFESLPGILNSIQEMHQILTDNGQNTISDEMVLNFIRNSLAYIFSAAPELKKREIISVLADQTAEPIRKEVMSLADVLREEGEAKGFEKAKLETARNMLSLGAEDSFILKAAGITKEQLEDLKQEK